MGKHTVCCVFSGPLRTDGKVLMRLTRSLSLSAAGSLRDEGVLQQLGRAIIINPAGKYERSRKHS